MSRSELTKIAIKKEFKIIIKEEDQVFKGNTSKKYYRLYNLFKVAREWNRKGYKCNRELLHNPDLGGNTLFKELCKDDINKEKILEMGERMFPKKSKKAIKKPMKWEEIVKKYGEIVFS